MMKAKTTKSFVRNRHSVSTKSYRMCRKQTRYRCHRIQITENLKQPKNRNTQQDTIKDLPDTQWSINNSHLAQRNKPKMTTSHRIPQIISYLQRIIKVSSLFHISPVIIILIWRRQPRDCFLSCSSVYLKQISTSQIWKRERYLSLRCSFSHRLKRWSTKIKQTTS